MKAVSVREIFNGLPVYCPVISVSEMEDTNADRTAAIEPEVLQRSATFRDGVNRLRSMQLG